jgi:hypothetical protein
MSDNIIKLHQARPAADDVVKALRNIADGKLDFPATTAVLVVGHTDPEVPCGEGDRGQNLYWSTFGMGPRNDTFTVRGLLMTALNRWGHDH